MGYKNVSFIYGERRMVITRCWGARGPSKDGKMLVKGSGESVLDEYVSEA